MSNAISVFLKSNPLLVGYVQKDLININALARYIKDNVISASDSSSVSAIGMDLRRYMFKHSNISVSFADFSDYDVNLAIRTRISEVVLNNNTENRRKCLDIVSKISQTKYFVSIVEGEKEIVLMTDYPLQGLLKIDDLKKRITHSTDKLGFISINFPIKLRLIPGIYSSITTVLAQNNISIHSFHTIGGEILILVENKDLPRAQEALQSLFISD